MSCVSVCKRILRLKVHLWSSCNQNTDLTVLQSLTILFFMSDNLTDFKHGLHSIV